MKNPAETLAAIKAALDNPSPELAAVPGALAYMRVDYETLMGHLRIIFGEEEFGFLNPWLARLAVALGIEVQP